MADITKLNMTYATKEKLTSAGMNKITGKVDELVEAANTQASTTSDLASKIGDTVVTENKHYIKLRNEIGYAEQMITSYNGYKSCGSVNSSTGIVQDDSNFLLIQCEGGVTINFKCSANGISTVAFLKSDNLVVGSVAPFAGGEIDKSVNFFQSIANAFVENKTTPDDTRFLLVSKSINGQDRTPQYIKINPKNAIKQQVSVNTSHIGNINQNITSIINDILGLDLKYRNKLGVYGSTIKKYDGYKSCGSIHQYAGVVEDNENGVLIPFGGGITINFKCSANGISTVAFLKSDNLVVGSVAPFAGGNFDKSVNFFQANANVLVENKVTPDDTKYIYVTKKVGDVDRTPAYINTMPIDGVNQSIDIIDDALKMSLFGIFGANITSLYGFRKCGTLHSYAGVVEDNENGVLIPFGGGVTINFKCSANGISTVAFLKSDNLVVGSVAPFAGGNFDKSVNFFQANANVLVENKVTPDDTKYIYVTKKVGDVDRTPAYINSNGCVKDISNIQKLSVGRQLTVVVDGDSTTDGWANVLKNKLQIKELHTFAKGNAFLRDRKSSTSGVSYSPQWAPASGDDYISYFGASDPHYPDSGQPAYDPGTSEYDQMTANNCMYSHVGYMVKCINDGILSNPDVILLNMSGINDTWDMSKSDVESWIGDIDDIIDADYTTINRSTMLSSLYWEINYLRSTYPTSKIVFVTANQQTNDNHKYFRLTYDKILSLMKLLSVPVIDVYGEAGIQGSLEYADGSKKLNNRYTIDGTHPNSSGYELIGNYVYNKLISLL